MKPQITEIICNNNDVIINIEKNKFGILFVPKNVKEDKKVKLEEDEFKKILEQMKRKQ